MGQLDQIKRIRFTIVRKNQMLVQERTRVAMVSS